MGLRDPLVLAVETATRMAGVALARGTAVLAERALDPRLPVSSSLLPAIEAVLGEVGATPGEIGAFGVSIGPGSFTGLRVGLATVKGLALEPPLPVAAVSTLEVLARAARSDVGEASGTLVALLDAQRGEVYAAAWTLEAPEPAGLGPVALEAGLFDPETLARALPGPLVVVGEGVPVAEAALRGRAGAGIRLLPAPGGAARAAALAREAAGRIAAGEAGDADLLAPHYGRRAEAEVRRTGRRVEGPEVAGRARR